MTQTIKYELSEDETFCTTKCPHKVTRKTDKGTIEIRKVGSWQCSYCKHFRGYDEEKQTVTCNQESEVSDGTTKKKLFKKKKSC